MVALIVEQGLVGLGAEVVAGGTRTIQRRKALRGCVSGLQ